MGGRVELPSDFPGEVFLFITTTKTTPLYFQVPCAQNCECRLKGVTGAVWRSLSRASGEVSK